MSAAASLRDVIIIIIVMTSNISAKNIVQHAELLLNVQHLIGYQNVQQIRSTGKR
jgi:hypothetical protein